MDDYFKKTLRATGYVALFIVAALVNYGHWWAILPLVAGLMLSVVLLLGWNGFVRSLTPPVEGALAAEVRWRKRFFLFALVKYPLVGLLIWWLTRVWDARSLMVFVAGFALLQAVIVLRTIGKMLTEGTVRGAPAEEKK